MLLFTGINCSIQSHFIAVTTQSGLKIAQVEAPLATEIQRRTRSGKFTLRQLRQTDDLIQLQSATNQFDSQKVSQSRIRIN